MEKNLERLREIAIQLGEINKEVVYVGGATVALYIDDKAAPLPQPSEDIDCVVEILTYNDWIQFEKKIRAKGFQDLDISGEDNNPPTCRKYFLGIKVDFMPTDENVLGYTNPWFKEGVSNSISKKVQDISIKILKLEYFIAAKLQAFKDRGMKDDIRFSQDLEDLTELLDGCTYLEKTIQQSEYKIKEFIINSFREFLINERYHEAIYGFLNYDSSQRNSRLEKILKTLQNLCH